MREREGERKGNSHEKEWEEESARKGVSAMREGKQERARGNGVGESKRWRDRKHATATEPGRQEEWRKRWNTEALSQMHGQWNTSKGSMCLLRRREGGCQRSSSREQRGDNIRNRH